MFFGILLALLLPQLGFSADTCLIDTQLSEAKSKVESITRKIVPLQKKHDSLTQTVFATTDEQQSYLKMKEALRVEIAKLKDQLAALQTALDYFTKKRAVFTKIYQGKRCRFFLPASIDPARYDEAVEKIAATFTQVFPTLSVSFQAPPEIYVYPNQESFNQFESSGAPIEGYFSKHRRCDMGKIAAEGPSKIQSVAIVDAPGLENFRHELAHLFLDRFIDPTFETVYSDQTPKAVNEGFAENIALIESEDFYKKRVEPLLVTTFNAASIMNLLTQKTELIGKEPYAEATLFVRWVSSLPDGFGLLRQFLKGKPEETEPMLRNYQTSHGSDRNGFDAYYAWRKTELERIKAGK